MLGTPIPLYAATARLRNRSVNGASQAARARAGDLATLAADLLARIPAVHVFDRADTETSSYQHASAHAAATSITALDASARYSPVTETLPGLGLACALIAGTIEVASGRLTIGGLLVLLAYLSSLIGPIQSLARLSTTAARHRQQRPGRRAAGPAAARAGPQPLPACGRAASLTPHGGPGHRPDRRHLLPTIPASDYCPA